MHDNVVINSDIALIFFTDFGEETTYFALDYFAGGDSTVCLECQEGKGYLQTELVQRCSFWSVFDNVAP